VGPEEWVPELTNLIVVSLQQAALFGLLSLGLVVSFRVARFPDLTVDGSFGLGAAIAATSIHYFASPWIGTVGAFLGGAVSGLLTGVISIRLKINRLLSGIVVMTMLYTISLRCMQRSNLPLTGSETVLSWTEALRPAEVWITITLGSVAAIAYLLVGCLLRTDVGLHMRVSGENPRLITLLGRNVNSFIFFALALSNGLIATSGALTAQHFGFADVNMGIGVLVIGLACVYLGEGLLKTDSIRNLLVATAAGSILYHVIKNLALRIGFAPTDLKLVTAVLVLVALGFRPLRDGAAVTDRPI